MTDSSTADELPPQTNGIVDNGLDDEEKAKMRPADIDADVREMERRKRVELIMNSKLFREELERIIETQLKDGSGTTGLLQQISDMVGVNKQSGNVFKNSSCVIPINDIRGIESMGYGKGEKILRCKLASVFRLIDLYGWTQSSNTLITARLSQENEQFLVNPYGMLFHEITASSLIKVDMQGSVLEQGTTNFSVNVTAFSLHAAVHAARPDLRCIIHVHTPSVVAVSAIKQGLLPLSQESVVIGEISTHAYMGGLLDADEKDKLARNLGPINKVLMLSNQGALCCGETIEEAFFNARNTILASESQLKLLPLGVDNLVLLNDEARKKMYDGAHRAPESSPRPDQPSILEGKVERKWRVGGIEFEALMRMMDNAGFRTGYIYRHPLVKGEPPKPKNDVEVPPAVSSLGYLLEEEELYRQGLWKKLEGGRKGNDRSRWLNSPNVYQKVEILETGTPDPKKITKWVAEGSPSHSSTPVKIDAALQFVPCGTNPKEFKAKQQQIKDYRRADKISAGPQSHILEGVTWEEARKMQDAAVTQTGDQVVLMGAASKGIIQRGHQHNAMVYKSPYAKNPFDCVTDEELEDYKKVVEKKAKGEYDTDYSESEGLSSAQMSKRFDGLHIRSPTSVTSETEEESRDEPRILRIETTTAPKPSQPEVVLSDVDSPVEQFLRNERASVNSYKSHHLINQQVNSCYRTYSHSGLPKGSYVIPNPVHFHIARINHTTKALKPIIKNININGRFNTAHNTKSVISLSFNEAHSVSVDISFETLRAFITPFAAALNLIHSPPIGEFRRIYNVDRSRRHVEYSSLYADPLYETLHTEEDMSLCKVRDNLFNELGVYHLEESFVEFTDDNTDNANECLADFLDVDDEEFTTSDAHQVDTNEFTKSSEISSSILDISVDQCSDRATAGSTSREQDSLESTFYSVVEENEDSSFETSDETYPIEYKESSSGSSGKTYSIEPVIEDIATKAVGATAAEPQSNLQVDILEPITSPELEDLSDVESNDTYTLEIVPETDESDETCIDDNQKSTSKTFTVRVHVTHEDPPVVEFLGTGDKYNEEEISDQNPPSDEGLGDMSTRNNSPMTNDFFHKVKECIEKNYHHVKTVDNEFQLIKDLNAIYKSFYASQQDIDSLQDVTIRKVVELFTKDENICTGSISSSLVKELATKYSSDILSTFFNMKKLEVETNCRPFQIIARVLVSHIRRTFRRHVMTNLFELVNKIHNIYEEFFPAPSNEENLYHKMLITDYSYELADGDISKPMGVVERYMLDTVLNMFFNCSDFDLEVRFSYIIIDYIASRNNDIQRYMDVGKLPQDYHMMQLMKALRQEYKQFVMNAHGPDKLKEMITCLVVSLLTKETWIQIIPIIPTFVSEVLDILFESITEDVMFEACINQFAGIIRDYLSEEGFEIRELIVFPELPQDHHLVKLIDKLKHLYRKVFVVALDENQLTELRVRISNSVLDLLIMDERFSDSDDSMSSDSLNISDKLFTISEYLVEILDTFFNSLDRDAFLQNMSEDVVQSTPRKDDDCDSIDGSVTSFKQDQTKSSESFWVSISTSKSSVKTPKKKFCLNADEIPLRPPDDLARIHAADEVPLSLPPDLSTSVDRALSPITEEPRTNLFGSNLSGDDLSSYLSFSSDEMYVSTDSASSGQIRVLNEVNFYRSGSTATHFSQKTDVVFLRKSKENRPPKSRDWMGFDGARF